LAEILFSARDLNGGYDADFLSLQEALYEGRFTIRLWAVYALPNIAATALGPS